MSQSCLNLQKLCINFVTFRIVTKLILFTFHAETIMIGFYVRITDNQRYPKA